jgi:hypothetical protein
LKCSIATLHTLDFIIAILQYKNMSTEIPKRELIYIYLILSMCYFIRIQK